ncbi:thiamine diphosphokinase [Deinococcus soli (ex Cha et al. 2016)]|uniref:Thiamine pyrophosphokinase n=2 Tax=Deinococcus soli (ex Cha et al. 2016) TaxID=1309411 RepID=A0ACC6KIG2_9DEIO|nr:thiamine diphosphokinase [Deinococcus soli (ex Cha et al. 2016)]MDR6219554.1 thiamine pyrophosphokinase [Deinococcus soli (ex Cha et al. 2016)]MDR6327233.1 thiamine pyrophosphokinase [Deinococcus soli (ex Cha et al. 2016)]MDR6752301.1 thiamine pyrophosphokinase [Deinococcus soli (ex Cha et al. 2016)]GGB63797.1 thiamine pyrophosphokinase [Deinococcus soli (ex Cha et al. 2016)]
MIAWVLVGGRLVDSPLLAALPRPDVVVAADGGARHAALLGMWGVGVRVDVWVGDFDSSAGVFVDAPREVHPAAKDETDAELAIRVARERGATELVLLGAFGGRFDHTLALALLALRLTEREGLRVTLSSGDEWGWPLTPASPLLLEVPRGATLSVLAVTDLRGLSLGGVRWPLEHADIPLGSGWTVSNEAQGGTVTASLREGRALVTVLPTLPE